MRAIRTAFNFDRTAYSEQRLFQMEKGGQLLLDAALILQKRQQTVLSQLAPKNGVFTLWNHYPSAEVSDPYTACQYFYHSHRTTVREHGHFHLFGLFESDGSLHLKGTPWIGDDAPSHLIAVSINSQGLPVKVFCPNRWVTKGHWLPANILLAQLDKFSINSNMRWSVTSRWLTGLVQLFWPQIEAVLKARDLLAVQLRNGRHWRTFLSDETIAVINYIPVNLHQQIAYLDR
jgi:hypothetical protein